MFWTKLAYILIYIAQLLSYPRAIKVRVHAWCSLELLPYILVLDLEANQGKRKAQHCQPAVSAFQNKGTALRTTYKEVR